MVYIDFIIITIAVLSIGSLLFSRWELYHSAEADSDAARQDDFIIASGMFWKRFFALLKILAVGLVITLLVAPEWPAFQDERHKIDSILGQRTFDFLVWEANALTTKGEASLAAGQHYLADDTRKAVVLDFLTLVGEVRHLESEMNGVFADPSVADPDEASRDLLLQIDEKRAKLVEIQPLAESILQEQVAAVLKDEGFDFFGQAFPPVQMHMTPLPYILIVSPREEIRQIYNIPLEHGLTVVIQEDIESAVLDEVDRSALVVPIGGLGFFPSMIVETGNINYLANTIAHEWAHHWLTLHPLGISYAASPALRTINETVASIFGDEIGAKVIERYYPEFLPPPEETPSNPEPDLDSPPPFDFNTEMAETRVRVDELLGQGRVEEAESYMEERRQFFWDHGYRIRKLNQAYFAFYGAYADRPGEQGDDPIGPAILAIRDTSSNMREFMDRMAGITSLKALEREAAGGPGT